MKIIQIERSGSTQTAYCPTPVQPDTTLAILATEGQIIERADLVECVSMENVARVIQVKSGGAYAGTSGRFFAIANCGTRPFAKKELHEVASANGNVLRGVVVVSGKEFRVETDMAKTHFQVIDADGACETGEIDAEGDVIANGGECVTQEWTAQDWSAMTTFVGAK